MQKWKGKIKVIKLQEFQTGMGWEGPYRESHSQQESISHGPGWLKMSLKLHQAGPKVLLLLKNTFHEQF